MREEFLTFRYDKATDSLYDMNGMQVLTGYSSLNYVAYETNDSKRKFKQVKELIEAGVKPDEIIEMKKAGAL